MASPPSLRPLSALSRTRPSRTSPHASRHFVSLEQVPTNIQHQSYLTGFVARELEKLERQMDNSRYSAGKLIDAMPAIYATAAALKDAKGPAATDIQRIIKWQLGELGAQLLQDKVEHADLTKAIATCARNVHSAGVLIGKLGLMSKGRLSCVPSGAVQRRVITRTPRRAAHLRRDSRQPHTPM